MNQNIEIESIDKTELDNYIQLFIKEKRSDQLLLCSRIYDMSQYLNALDLSELGQLKCVANTLKLYGSAEFYQQHIDLKILKLLEKNQHQFVVLRILFFASVTHNNSIQSYGVTVISKILEVLKLKNDELTDEALKCLYNYLNFYSLVKVQDPLQNALIDSGFPVDELFLIVRELVLKESVTSSALNCLLQFKDYIASQVIGKSKVNEPVELIQGIVVEQKDKELVDYLIKYLDERFTHENEETGTVFGIIAYLFSWMCFLAFPINENEKIKPWLLYLKSVLLPETVSRNLVLGADKTLPHRIISAFSATATLGITKEEVAAIPDGDVRPPPMSSFVSERLQELVFNLFEENGSYALI